MEKGEQIIPPKKSRVMSHDWRFPVWVVAGGAALCCALLCIIWFPRQRAAPKSQPNTTEYTGNNTSKRLILTTPNGTIMSDPDGSGWGHYTDPENAVEWVIECPLAFDAIDITVDGNVDYGIMTVTWSDYGGYVRLTGDVSSRFVTDSGRAVVSLATWCRGFTLRYECTVWSGSSPFELTKLKSPSGIVMSDADGASSDTYYSADSLARWLVSCPETTRYIELNATSFLGEDDELTVVPIRDELPHLANLTSFSGYRCWKLTVAANKTLLQLRGRSGGPGFTLHYMCVGDYPLPPAPGSPLVCGSTLTKPNGTLMSDPDGSGSSCTTPPRSSIEWVLECPLAFNAINITADGYLDDGVMTVAWRGYEGYVPLTGDAWSRFVADAGRAVVSLATGSSYCRGVTMRYECTTLAASTPFELLTSPSGIVMSDADGASSDTYYNAVDLARWLVSCPETTRYIELNATSFLGEGDELTVVPIRDELPHLADLTSLPRLPLLEPHCRCQQDAAATAWAQRWSGLHPALHVRRRLPAPSCSRQPPCVRVNTDEAKRHTHERP